MNNCTRISRSTAGIISAIVVGLAAMNASAQDACLDQHVTPSDALAFKYFGSSLDAEGDTLIVSAIQDNELGLNAGAAYVFNRIDGEWVEVQKLLASDGGPGDKFGQFGVAIDGDRVAFAVGNHLDPDAPAGGAVYIFEHDGNKWIETAKITPSQGNFQGGFGASVDLRGDDLVVGAVFDNENGNWAGAAYVFRHDGSKWVEVQKLLASNGSSNDSFGLDLTISDECILVGSPGFDIEHPEGGSKAGAVYCYSYDARASAWMESQILMPSDAIGGKNFGKRLDVDGDLAVINAHADPANLRDVYIFNSDSDTGFWVEQQKLDPWPNGWPDFGRNVAIGGGRILVSDDTNQTFGWPHGVAHVFEPNAGGEWVQTALLRPNDGPWVPNFGLWSIAITEQYAFVDATGENGQAGAVYVYDLNPTPGDVNCDGVVNGDDLAHFLGEWGRCDVCEYCPADVNDDCTVDGADLAIMLGNWG